MKKSTNETMKNNAKATKNTNTTRKEEKTMENKNEFVKCENFLPAINNAVNHYNIDMAKTETILKTEKAMGGAIWLKLDSDIKAIKAKKARNENILKDENATDLKKKVASAEITECDNDLAILEPLFAGVDILKSNGVITIDNSVAVYMYGIKKCSYLYHADKDVIMEFVANLNEYGFKHYENSCNLVAGKQIADKEFYKNIENDISVICTMLCDTANFKVKSKHIKRVLDKVVTVKTSGDKNLKGKTTYSYSKNETLCNEICAMLAEKLGNFDCELGKFVKQETK